VTAERVDADADHPDHVGARVRSRRARKRIAPMAIRLAQMRPFRSGGARTSRRCPNSPAPAPASAPPASRSGAWPARPRSAEPQRGPRLGARRSRRRRARSFSGPRRYTAATSGGEALDCLRHECDRAVTGERRARCSAGRTFWWET
jgi:hypothetical protein